MLRAMLGDQPLFTLDVGGVPLRVVRFFGREGVSSLFDFRLELAGPEVDLGSLVDRPALLQIGGIEAPRHVHGVLAEVEYVGESRSFHLYEAELVPWIWRLQHRQDCRIFQDKATPKILEDVLVGAGLAKDWLRFDLTADYAPRNYCVQYRESDLAFISRLMEEDGIFYFFEHAADKHVLVIADHPGAHRPIVGAPALWFTPASGDMVADREHVQQFRFGERIRPGKVSLRDFNLHKPDLALEAKDGAKRHTELEVYAYPGRYQDQALGAPHQGQTIAKTRLEALQSHRRSGAGASDCPRLCAGHTFELIGHSRHELDGSYRIVQVTHAGSQPQVLDQDASGDFSYSNEFQVTETKQPFRAPVQTPRPRMGGLQTATVVGPEGEEVYPDEHGRVKVQFHWDREDLFDETSSCWVRVSQQWAGNGWGTMFIPRIGHEVLVDFIEGDPDRPVIVGRIYTGINKPPYPLPAQKTKSTIKSESSLGGGGFNELRFEDLKNQEEVFLHAQKDWNTVILNNLTESVGANRTSTIGSNETITVGSNRTVNVGSNDATTVGSVHSITMTQPSNPPPVIPPTGVKMQDQFHQLTTGLATVTVTGGDVIVSATGNIALAAGGSISITAAGGVSISGAPVDVTSTKGDLTLKGGEMVKINC